MITKLSKITSMDNCFIFFFPNNLVDKPGKSRDFYHTCYTLSGLSVAQNMPDGQEAVLGDESNLLVCNEPIFLGLDSSLCSFLFFQNQHL